jgi:hypothetical protein
MKATAHNTHGYTDLLRIRIRHHANLAACGDSQSAVYVEELRQELSEALEAEREFDQCDVYHAFVDKSKRKPYLCGICGRDITDPYHQPRLFKAVTYATVEAAVEAVEEIAPRRDERQMGLFTSDEMRGY